MDTGLEPARARSNIDLMQKRGCNKRLGQDWKCRDCGRPTAFRAGRCTACRGGPKAISDQSMTTPTDEYRDLLSDETRERLEEWERDERRKHRPG